MTDAMGNLMDLRPSFLKGRSSSGTTSRNVLQALWQAAGMPDEALAQVSLTGADPVLPSSFAVGQAAQTNMAAAALAAAEIWHLRGGARQQVSVDMLHAAQECRSYFRINGVTLDPFDPITGAYRCGDGGWVRIHANFPTTATARLPCWAARRAKARPARPSSGRWRAGPPSTSNRPPPTPAWWSPPCAASMNGIIIRKGRPLPRSRCSRWNASARPIRVPAQVWSGSAPAHGHPRARPDPHHRRPGLRPRAGRLWRRRDAGEFPNLPNIDNIIDTSRGKLSVFADLDTADGRIALGNLLRSAHVFVQGYRPGAMAAQGFGPQDAARIRPGIVYVSLSAYGEHGPWARRRGFDSLVQTASGFNHAEAQAAGQPTPKPLPMQILDHASGYLMAFAAQAALARQATEGGSWHVRVSLAQTAHWLRGLGRIEGGLATPMPAIDAYLQTEASGFGELVALRHAAQFSRTPARWTRPSCPPGTHPTVWPWA